MVVICDKRKTCKHAKEENPSHRCGGSQPHSFHGAECNKCPMDKDARCLPYDNRYDESLR